MSLVTYNGVTLPYPFHTNFVQRPLYDDVSGTDWYCTEFDISLQCVVNAAYVYQLANDLSVGLVGSRTQSPAEIMDVIRSRLLQPRKTLSVTFNGVDLIPQATAGPGTVDVQNGPKPQSCSITQMNNTTFLVIFHVIAHYWENNLVTPANAQGNIVTNRVGNNVLYNRWSETLDINNLNFSTKVREGKFIIRSDNAAGFIAEKFIPEMAVVGVPPGFLRESSHYTVSPDGLGIQYRLVDRQVFKLPPNPAYEATGEYTEESPRLDAKKYVGVNLTLKGGPNSSQARMVEMACAVATQKLRIIGVVFDGVPDAQKSILEGAAIRIGMYENTVSVSIRASQPVGNLRLKGLAGVFGAMTHTPFSDNNPGRVPNPYPPRGTQGIAIRAAAYFDPSLTTTKVTPATGSLNAGLEVGQAGKTREE